MLAIVAVGAATVLPLARPASADQLSDAQAQATQIEHQIEVTSQRISALGQQYDKAQEQLQALDAKIDATKGKIDRARQKVAHDKVVLTKAAVNAYMSDGAAATQNPLFASNQQTLSAQKEYNHVAEGNLQSAVADLRVAQAKLDHQQSILQVQQTQADAAVQSARDAQNQANAESQRQQAALAQVKGQIQTLVEQKQHAQELAAQQATAQRLHQAQLEAATSSGSGGSHSSSAGAVIPPPSSGGSGAAAVAAAESQVGVPYVWGGETPGVGFDCSGLTAWAWGRAGVPLPHYSGAQMADSARVPVSALEPGDLLFYGPGGSEHVAMYIGGGQMIEAPYTGATVRNTPVRLGGNFVGAGRP